MPISFLVLSDLHFGRLASSSDFALPGTDVGHESSNAISMKSSLIQTAAPFHPVGALVSGDLTSIASPAEFDGAAGVVEEIATGCHITLENVFYTFGNHDANRRISALGTASNEYPEDERYGKVAAEMGNLFVRNRNCDVSGPVPGSGLFVRESFDLIVLNTGYYCVHDQAVRHGKLGAEQLNWLREILARKRPPNRWLIVMLHHHPFNYAYPTPGLDISTLEEGAELLDLLGAAGVDFVCHGHRHHPRLVTRVQGGWSKPISFFCAGSVGVTANHRFQGEIPNLFHILELQTHNAAHAATGVVHSFEYSAAAGWIRLQRTAAVPLDPKQQFGSTATLAEQKAAISGFVAKALAADASTHVGLPTYEQLCLDVRCMPLESLKEMLRDVALEAQCGVVGNYPSEVILRRNNAARK
jgi:hypothetical protein